MLSTMREKTKVIMLVLLVAFVGWLVFDVGMGVGGMTMGAQDVGSVNGKPIRYNDWMEAYRVASEQARAQNPGAAFSREDQKQLEDQAFEQLVSAELMREEYRRRGVSVTNAEIIDLVRRAPPPEVTQSADFQTDGQFDPAKYERFLASNNEQAEQFRLAMEERYRDELPRYKLLQSVTSDIYLADAKLWTLWRDTHESLTVRALVIRPAVLPDSLGLTDEEDARRYYNANREEFRRPASAALSVVYLNKLPTTVDSALLHQRMIGLRDSINRGLVSFEDAASAVSTDSASAAAGGSLGTFGRGAMVAAFDRAVFSAPVGRITDPVYTPFGVHLIRVDRRQGDSVTARHILVPNERFGDRLDELEAKADSLDRMAAEQDNGALLDSVARVLNLQVEKAPTLFAGLPYVLGRYRIPDIGVWTFIEGIEGRTSPVVETAGGYYVFRVDTLTREGIPPFEVVAGPARVQAMLAKKREAGQRIAEEAVRRLTAGRSMEQVADELGIAVQTLGPFVRTSTVPVLGTASAAIGAAFRLRIGERSGLLNNDEAFFVLQPTRRVPADSTAWAAQKDAQRAQMIQLARRARAQMYIDGLRRNANVRDRRDEIMRENARLADSTIN